MGDRPTQKDYKDKGRNVTKKNNVKNVGASHTHHCTANHHLIISKQKNSTNQQILSHIWYSTVRTRHFTDSVIPSLVS